MLKENVSLGSDRLNLLVLWSLHERAVKHPHFKSTVKRINFNGQACQYYLLQSNEPISDYEIIKCINWFVLSIDICGCGKKNTITKKM